MPSGPAGCNGLQHRAENPKSDFVEVQCADERTHAAQIFHLLDRVLVLLSGISNRGQHGHPRLGAVAQ